MEFRETNTPLFRISYFGRWRGVWHVSLRNTSGATLWIDNYEVPPNGNIDYEICPRGRRPLAFNFDVSVGGGRQFYHLGWGADSGRVGLLLRDRYGTGRWFLEDPHAVAKPVVLPLAPAMAAPLKEAATAPLEEAAPAVVEEAADDTDVRDFYRLVLQQVYFRDTALLVSILRSQGLPMDAFLRVVSRL